MLVTWIIVGVWAFIALGFFVAMISEARKYEGEIGIINVIVAVIWPFWLVWYSFVIVSNWWTGRKFRK